jgi:hypothetical protein
MYRTKLHGAPISRDNSKDLLKMRHNIGEILGASSFKNFGFSSSEPAAFDEYGFRKNRSCETQLLEFIDDVTKNMENSPQTDVLIMDFSKAFDQVSHNLLTHKLHYNGIQAVDVIPSGMSGM